MVTSCQNVGTYKLNNISSWSQTVPNFFVGGHWFRTCLASLFFPHRMRLGFKSNHFENNVYYFDQISRLSHSFFFVTHSFINHFNVWNMRFKTNSSTPGSRRCILFLDELSDVKHLVVIIHTFVWYRIEIRRLSQLLLCW